MARKQKHKSASPLPELVPARLGGPQFDPPKELAMADAMSLLRAGSTLAEAAAITKLNEDEISAAWGKTP